MSASTSYAFDYLRVDEVGPVRVVTLDNPEKMNAFSEELHDEYAALWPMMARDAGARAVVLTGAGKAFSAGGSIDDFELFRTDFEARRKTLRSARRLVDDMLSLHLPVVLQSMVQPSASAARSRRCATSCSSPTRPISPIPTSRSRWWRATGPR